MEIAKLILEFLKILAWPITTVFLAIYFRKSLKAILARLIKATLPGGVSLDFKDQIDKAQTLSEKVLENPKPKLLLEAAQPLSSKEVTKKLIALGLEPLNSELDISYFRALANSDTTLALAALRIEMETMTKDIISVCKLPIQKKRPTSFLIRELEKSEIITNGQSALALQVLQICNQVVHGQKIDREEAEMVIDTAEVLYNAFRDWLSTK